MSLGFSDDGQVFGFSNRYIGSGADNGTDAWVFNGTTTIQLGFTGGAYTGSNGLQFSQSFSKSVAGQIVGYSRRYTGVDTYNGRAAWVFNGTTTTQIGLTGGIYTLSSGYQESYPASQNAAGQIAGYSERVGGLFSTENGLLFGRDVWVFNGVTTTQIGLTGGAYTSSAGYQRSSLWFHNDAGQIVGVSNRYTGVQTDNGVDTWVFNGTTTTQIGLTGGAYTGSAGYQLSQPQRQNAAGQVVGLSRRITGVSAPNGWDAWVFNGTTTTQIGLTGPGYTGSAGYQFSEMRFQNGAGQIAGISQRITGVSTQIGQDAWYFDPITLRSDAVIGSVRASDNFAFSSPGILTEGGFMLGYYQFFAGGVSPAVDRAFIYRPDLGFTDLGELVTGGLTPSGWNTLLRPQFSDALNTIVGFGYVNGQTTGQSVFVMTIPTPSAAVLLAIGGLVTTRRRRAV